MFDNAYIPTHRDAPELEIEAPDFTDLDRKQSLDFFREFIRIYAHTVDDLEWYWRDQARERGRLGIERSSREWWRLVDLFAARKRELQR